MQEEDSAWKEILEDYFREFLLFFFPLVHDEVDWGNAPEWLDKEFQAIRRDQDDGRRVVDKLAKVRLLNGREEWILIHVEVQGQSQAEFNERMLRYNFLIWLRHRREVLSLAVLTDEVKSFRPGLFFKKRRGMVHVFRFPVVKLLDYEDRREELEASTSPFSLVVLAHLEARRAAAIGERFHAKFGLARRLYERGFGGEDIRRLHRFIDWILDLPVDLELALLDKIRGEIQGKVAMPYLAKYERFAMQRGRVEGLQEAVRLQLELRFAQAGVELASKVDEIKDVARLRSLLESLVKDSDLGVFKGLLETS